MKCHDIIIRDYRFIAFIITFKASFMMFFLLTSQVTLLMFDKTTFMIAAT